MNILVVDDEQNILRTTCIALKTMGHQAFQASSSRQAERVLNEEPIDAIILDMMLGNENGLDYLDKLEAEGEHPPVVVFTAHSSIETAVQSMKRGAYDYIQKPFIPEDLRQLLAKLEKSLADSGKLKELKGIIESSNPTLQFESNEPEMQETFRIATKAAASEANILILGSSGTGKTMLARHVHANSQRRDKPFVTVNCPSLSKELLESELFGHIKGSFTGATKDTWGKVSAADGGTLFLDEIGEVALEIQPKLLRLLQDREFERVGETRTRKANVRVLAATNRDLSKEVEAGTFREDLFYRLNVIGLQMPSLRERPGDILSITQRYVDFFAAQLGRGRVVLAEDAQQAIVDYAWPGNLRELKNVIERSLILSEGQELTKADLPVEFHAESEGRITTGSLISLEELEAAHIKRVVAKTASLDEASNVLGIDPATLYRKRKKLGLC
ncbi:sigma-54 dependent transcriptional regulator [Coraliomargarita algicola]|uniref:Sigma-54 dependent transcriptional regulator n=2 Tax=Coraliomargaritaceae TaxID=3056371 RepID=A0ABU1AU23_9BACT|nr:MULTISPECIES: sigma-54 dependent transcriptional regulator [unclassified Coraliomargarita]MBT64430.1 sigma-54-dependent Fis family transcriptional regulator [Puniceicoccaceae bacterium]MDQ8206452.1 sigma-54 dependent transcriptional regulator [Coraliomargarita sp. SDUM461003]WPJ97188.1 sigma-54 dependent transcriptional regulator [Coraliomargarita sp. J2-16]HBR94419.1 sigma-54-dependent Fis family transcriptional regulator [Opitutae bacterium]|tara:strand:+ start:6321 stop:7655 length:1335 start_codon:yes stop_codon:yes gene_type:complete